MLERYLTQGKEFMVSELGFCPDKSVLSIKDEESFKQLISQRDLPRTSKGIFLPRSLQAIVKQDNLESTLPVAIHEYLGHGSFYEYNKQGRLFRQHELKLDGIENKIIQDKVPKGEQFKLRFSKEKSSIRKADDEYVVNVNIADPLAIEYLNLAQELNKGMEGVYHIYEGFATWLEDFILSGMGMREVFLNTEIHYREFYQAFKDYESEKGHLALITKVGFPVKDKNR